MKRLATCLALLGMLAGCANEATRHELDAVSVDCQSGFQTACYRLPALQAQADHEKAENAGKVALGILLIPLLVLAAAASSQPNYYQPSTVIVVPARRY